MPTETLATSAPPSCEPTLRYRYRLRFAKTGDLRLVSHHDLMHVFERMMRRAEIPFAVTQGFHPQPKMSFALSLALGVVGRNEVFDIELTRDVDPDELIERFNRVSPAGLSFSSVVRLEKKPSSQVRRMFYRLTFPTTPLPLPRYSGGEGRGEGAGIPRDGGTDASGIGDTLQPGATSPSPPTPLPRSTGGEGSIADLSDRIAKFLALSESWIIRTRPQRRRLNIRPFVDSLSHDSTSLSLILWVTPIGAARPEEIVGALGLSRLFDDGAVLERTHLELLGELPEHERFVPDLAACATSAPANETPNDVVPETADRAATHTALMDNPMSFDS